VAFCLCVCVSLREHISQIFADLCSRYIRGSAPFWHRCDTLCTSCFVDDVMFVQSGYRMGCAKKEYIQSNSIGGSTVCTDLTQRRILKLAHQWAASDRAGAESDICDCKFRCENFMTEFTQFAGRVHNEKRKALVRFLSVRPSVCPSFPRVSAVCGQLTFRSLCPRSRGHADKLVNVVINSSFCIVIGHNQFTIIII